VRKENGSLLQETGIYAGRQSITAQGRHGSGGEEDNLSDFCCGLSRDMTLTCSWVFKSPAMYWPSPSGNDTDATVSATKPGYRNRLHHTQNILLQSHHKPVSSSMEISMHPFNSICSRNTAITVFCCAGDEQTFQATRINFNC